jgi:hypothetical protein
MTEKHTANGNGAAAGFWQQAADEALAREKAARVLAEADWSHPEERPVNSARGPASD